MPKSNIIILGTSREWGNTRKLVDLINHEISAPLVNLSEYSIGHYDYQNRNKDDDFIGLASDLLGYQQIIFATPVYWYSMSSQMKIFFDRLSDVIREYKDIGRALAGRNTYLIATGTDFELPYGFEKPFELASKYLDMQYKGSVYACFKQDLVVTKEIERIAETFRQKLIAIV